MTLDHHIALGAWLRQKREDAGLNIRDAAERLRMSKTKLSRIETGQTRPLTLDEIDSMCSLYKVDEETTQRVRNSLPPMRANHEYMVVSHQHPAMMARIGAISPWMISGNHLVVVMRLVENAINNLPAITHWLNNTDTVDSELFINQCPELSELDALRDFLRACLDVGSVAANYKRRYAAALAILDTAWLAEQTDSVELAEAVKSACLILKPEMETYIDT